MIFNNIPCVYENLIRHSRNPHDRDATRIDIAGIVGALAIPYANFMAEAVTAKSEKTSQGTQRLKAWEACAS